MARGTTIRPVRISDELWDAAKAKAEAEGTNVSAVVREKLHEYVTTPPPAAPRTP